MNRQEIKEALAKVQELCEKHNKKTSNYAVTAYPYEREMSDGSNYEIGLVLREPLGYTFNSFDVIQEALGMGLYCNATLYSENYFGSCVKQKPGMPALAEGDVIATVCKLVSKRA